jgi:hypothetical protein
MTMLAKLWQFLSGYKTYFLVGVQAVGNAYMVKEGYTVEQIGWFNGIMAMIIGTNKAASTLVPKQISAVSLR